MQKPELVIFDCDGVLVDSEVIGNTIMARSLSEHGLVVTLKECMDLFVGGTLAGTKVEAERLGAKLPGDWVAQVYKEVYAKLREGCPLIEGVVEVLDALDLAGVPYCVASNGSLEKMGITLGQNGLLERFGGRVYSAQALDTAKPDPKLFLHATQGIRPERCVVIEDSMNGIRGAINARIPCFAYATEGGSEFALKGVTPFTEMAHLPALLDLR